MLTSDCTVYCNIRETPLDRVSVSELQKLISLVVKRARVDGVRVYGALKAKELLKRENEYKKACDEYDALGALAIKQFHEIYKTGLHAPTTDNKELDNCYEAVYKMNALSYGLIASYNNLYKRLHKLLESMDAPNYSAYIKINLM